MNESRGVRPSSLAFDGARRSRVDGARFDPGGRGTCEVVFDHALDLLIAKLTAIGVENEKAAAPTTAPTSPLRIALVPAPPRGAARARRKR